MQSVIDRSAGSVKRQTWLRRALRVVRQIVGAPDYAAYVEHCARAGAGHAPPLSEREYVREFFEAKGKVVRCC